MTNAKTILEDLASQMLNNGYAQDTNGDTIDISVSEAAKRLEADLLAKLPEKKPYEEGDHDDWNWERRFIKAAHNNAITEMEQAIRQYFGGGK